MASRKRPVRKKTKAPGNPQPRLPLSAPPSASQPDLDGSDIVKKPGDGPQETPDVSFLTIPPELRNRIYGYLLVEEQPIRLEIRGTRPKNSGNKEVVRRGALKKQNRRRKYDRKTKAWIELDFEHTSILYVNKQILHEARAILYGDNILSFKRTTVLKDFLQVIGDLGQHLRYIRIESGGYVKTTIKSTLMRLCIARGLRALEIHHSDVCRGRSYHSFCKLRIEGIANDCKVLAKSLQASYKQLNLTGNAVDVFALFMPPCCICIQGKPMPHMHISPCMIGSLWVAAGWCKCNRDKVFNENNERMQKELRIAIGKHLMPKKAVS